MTKQKHVCIEQPCSVCGQVDEQVEEILELLEGDPWYPGESDSSYGPLS